MCKTIYFSTTNECTFQNDDDFFPSVVPFVYNRSKWRTSDANL